MADAFDAALARARSLGGPLDNRLAVVREAYRRLLPDYDAAVDRLVARLRAGGAGDAAPRPGDPFPDFALPDQAGRIRRLAALLSRGPVALAFLRGGWCDMCELSLGALAEVEPRLRAAGAFLMGVSPQRATAAAAQLGAACASFPMLADMGCGLATELGLTVVVDDDLAAMLDGFGFDLRTANGDDGRLLPIPAVFVIGRDGRVAARWVDPDPRRRPEPEAVAQAAISAAAAPR